MLLNPNQIHQVLKENLPRPQAAQETKNSLSRLLEENNLSPQELLDNLSSMVRSGETDGIRMRAIETGLKLNGLLDKDNEKSEFNVTIIINDGEIGSVNPILIPRQ